MSVVSLKKRTSLSSRVLLGFLCTVGCTPVGGPEDQQENIPAEQVYAQIRDGYILIYHNKWGVPDGYQLSNEESLYVDNAVTFDFDDIARNSTDWRTAHQRILKQLDDNVSPVGVGNGSLTSFPRFIKEQYAAVDMLTRSYGEGHPPSLLMAAPVTPETQEVIGFYLNLMVKNNSPHADIGLEALEKMEGYWSDEQISGVAGALARGYEKKYGDTISAAKLEARRPSASKAYHGRLLEAVAQLEAIGPD